MRNGEPGWFASLLGAAVLIAGGFALGLVAGVVSEEPELVVGHLVGRSDEVAWLPEGEPEFTEPGGELAPPPDGLEAGEETLLAALPEIDVPDRGPMDGAPSPQRLERREQEAAEEGRRPAAPSEPLPAVAAAPPAPSAPRDVSSLPSAAQSDPPAASSARSGFSVQVGAFADSAAAASVRDKLVGKGFDTYVSSAGGDGKWRVRVGPVSSRSAAEALAGRLKSEERLPTWVLSEGGG